MEGCFVSIENLLFSVAHSLTILTFWVTCCSFYISICCFTWHLYVTEIACFLNSHESSLPALNFSCRVSSPLSAFIEVMRFGALLWIRLWLKGKLWLVWLLSRKLNLFPYPPSACSAGDPGSIPGSGRSPREGIDNPLQYSCLENPMDRGAWQAMVHRVTRVGHDWTTQAPPPPP